MTEKFVQTLLVGCCMTAAVSCSNAPTAPRVAEYEVLTIAPTDAQTQSNYSATIRGRQDIDIYPQVSGFISKLNVNEGETVRPGQTLFIIDQVPYQAALRTAEANVDAANAGVATAQLTFDSKKELFAKNVISAYELQTSENALLTAKAQLAQAEAQRVNAANNLSYTVVKSPSHGVVGTLPYRVGALVGPSMPQPLTTVSDNSDMYVYFSMNESQLLNLTRRYGSVEKALASMPAIELRAERRIALLRKGTHRNHQRRDRPLDGKCIAQGRIPQQGASAPQRQHGQCGHSDRTEGRHRHPQSGHVRAAGQNLRL